MAPQRDSKERNAAIFRVKKVQEDREKTATLVYENGNSRFFEPSCNT
jgi:hypothetical protein